jgi:hypothetical protein
MGSPRGCPLCFTEHQLLGKRRTVKCVLHSISMRLNFIFVSVGSVLFYALAGGHSHAQCLQNHYVSDGAPSSQRDCQPLVALTQVAPQQMSPAAKALVSTRHTDLVHAAAFYGYKLDEPGWTYQQSASPILQKHLLLTFTHADPEREASHFVAVVPLDSSELVQVVPAFAHGLRLFDPGWQRKGTYAVFNRLLKSERVSQPITVDSEWVEYAALFIALSGGVPSVPTDSDSVKASWDLTAKRATTPVIIVLKNGGAVISVSDVSDPAHSVSWKLVFDKHGQIQQADKESLAPGKVLMIETAKEPAAGSLPAHSSLNP